MPTPLTYLKMQKNDGSVLDIPVYYLSDFSDSSLYYPIKKSALRVMTPKGVGALMLSDLTGGSAPYIMTPTGIQRIDTTITQPNPNLLLYSEDFSQTAWLKGGSTTAIANNIAMPVGDGTWISQSKTVEVGKTYTFTVWVQANAGDYSNFDIFAGRTNGYTIDYGSKECIPTDTLTAHSFTFTATTTTCYVGFDNVNGLYSPNILAQAKLEEGPSSTGYLKTP